MEKITDMSCGVLFSFSDQTQWINVDSIRICCEEAIVVHIVLTIFLILQGQPPHDFATGDAEGLLQVTTFIRKSNYFPI